MEKLKQAHGNFVVGDGFWDREAEMRIFVERIREGAHVLLVAQRRMGKTSLIHEAARRLETTHTCLLVDLQRAASAADAVAEVSVAMHSYKPLWKKTKELFANILDGLAATVEKLDVGELGITLRAALTAGTWAQKGDQLFSILAAAEKPVVLMFDELPIMVNRLLKGPDFTITPERRRRTDQFMSWLRKNALQHQGRVRIVLSGSIGLEPVLRQAHLSATINNFAPFELKPWDEPTAVGCLNALANQYGVRFEEGVPARMVTRLGCAIPHHVQMFFSHLSDTCVKRGNMTCSAEDADKVYETDMLSTRGHAELTHYEERLKGVLAPEVFSLAIDMLSEAAVTGCLTRDSLAALQREYEFPKTTAGEVQKEILWVLEHDGYLKRTANGYVFVSNLVRDWWKNRYSLFFIPVSRRKR